MRLRRLHLLVGVPLGLMVLVNPVPALPDTVLLPEEAAKAVGIRNVRVQDGVISGELVNKSPRLVRNVQLLIRYVWHWKNEFRPGENDPGKAIYHTVKKEIAPGRSVSFTYSLSPPLLSRPDGHFETEVSIAGFSEVVPR
ncbi:MAG: hypothetical protein ACE5JU_01475 [Candidatus Binatia bacterium]